MTGPGFGFGQNGDEFRLTYPRIVDPDLLDVERRRANRIDEDLSAPVPVIIELSVQHAGGMLGAQEALLWAFERLASAASSGGPAEVSAGYWRCVLSLEQIDQLLTADRSGPPEARGIRYVWTDYPVEPLIDSSARTIKAPAGRQLFNADGRDIAWAVVDSGIDADHAHFALYRTLVGPTSDLHRSFLNIGAATIADAALRDEFGHGTHVAGIIAGRAPDVHEAKHVVVAEHVSLAARLSAGGVAPGIESLRNAETQLVSQAPTDQVELRVLADTATLSGIAPRCELVSLRVLDGQGNGRSSAVISALRYVREEANRERLRIHGVNLSLGYDYNASTFACGRTPLCVEVDRLVRSGVVVVAAAGNTGFGRVGVGAGRFAALTCTINDPGNAELAITVGSTHRSEPHATGISSFSSKGPTVDGRFKPDLVAPGERITSCATGALAMPIAAIDTDGSFNGAVLYVDDTGTSVAAPHVSGAIAAFLSSRREFIGMPQRVKSIFIESAMPLGREPYFEGHGMVNLLGALQLV